MWLKFIQLYTKRENSIFFCIIYMFVCVCIFFSPTKKILAQLAPLLHSLHIQGANNSNSRELFQRLIWGNIPQLFKWGCHNLDTKPESIRKENYRLFQNTGTKIPNKIFAVHYNVCTCVECRVRITSKPI